VPVPQNGSIAFASLFHKVSLTSNSATFCGVENRPAAFLWIIKLLTELSLIKLSYQSVKNRIPVEE
jgi:hypothetical protein